MFFISFFNAAISVCLTHTPFIFVYAASCRIGHALNLDRLNSEVIGHLLCFCRQLLPVE